VYIEKCTHDYFEYEQGHTNIIVKGRLKSNIHFWIDIGAYDFIIDTLLTFPSIVTLCEWDTCVPRLLGPSKGRHRWNIRISYRLYGSELNL
jgi:hypothetical protein